MVQPLLTDTGERLQALLPLLQLFSAIHQHQGVDTPARDDRSGRPSCSASSAGSRLMTANPTGKLTPNSSRKPCIWLAAFVRRTRDSRTRCSIDSVCWASVLGNTKRIVGREAA